MKIRFGKIDKYMAQHIMSGLYGRDPETGEIRECAPTDDGCALYGRAKACSQGTGVDLYGGSNDCKIAILDGRNSMMSWVLGNGSDWEGAWDEYHFKNEGKGRIKE